MVIRELYIKNFGKFSEKHFYLKDGVQVISGENEFGKTTLHLFIRAMLFGLERGRGRAAAKDDFTKYEPWDGGSYAGVMRFECGGRCFRLERTFGNGQKSGKKVLLICEDDGEELSPEHGDLEMLLGSLTAELFDSTVSVGQLKSRPGQALSEALENYAANYYETGGADLDLRGAVQTLREKRKKTERAIREEQEKEERKRQKMLQECEYLERDMESLRGEYEERREELHLLKRSVKMREEETKIGTEETETRKSRGKHILFTGLGGIFAGGIGLLWSRFAAVRAGGFSVSFAGIAGILLLIGLGMCAIGLYEVSKELRERKKSRQDKKSAAREVELNGQIDQNCQMGELRESGELREKIRQAQWQMSHLRSEWKEKEIRCQNIQEQCGERMDSEIGKRLKAQREALEMAEEVLIQTAKETSDATSQKMNLRASEIFSEITDGRYRGLKADAHEGISVWDGVRRIPAERLSRGTLEQIYFAVRMAAAEMLLEEPMPLIFDDAFAFYDDKRLESVIKWLSRQKNQVIILSCHNREENLLGQFM